MKPFPVVFHLGPFTLHTYGIGLAIAFYVGFIYAERRLSGRGLDTSQWGRDTLVLIVSGLLGARLAHVATNWSYYHQHPGEMIAVWQGGLASFGALATAIPTGVMLARRRWAQHALIDITDALAPALVLAWSIGRFLGPQFMPDGGGHPTTAWFGMYYAGQALPRVPVPLIQGLEDLALWGVLMLLSTRTPRRGLLTGVALVVWGVVRAVDEYFLLGPPSSLGSRAVQVAGVVCALGGALVLCRHWRTADLPN